MVFEEFHRILIRTTWVRRVIFWAVLLLPAWTGALGSRSDIYRAYVSNRMDLWEKAMNRMEDQYRASGDLQLLYNLTEAQYGYIPYCISMDRKKEARELLSKAEANIELLEKEFPENPRVFSLKGALNGYAVLLEPLKAPVFGRRSMNANEKAMRLDPNEPQVWMERANMEFYKPAILGGSVSQAVPLYEQAVRLFEASPYQVRENWLYLNCLANLGLAYEKNGQVVQAGEVYRKLLRLEPSFTRVRDDLYPGFREKHALN
jgi:tetratricopeptide (TPR) repeat protein